MVVWQPSWENKIESLGSDTENTAVVYNVDDTIQQNTTPLNKNFE